MFGSVHFDENRKNTLHLSERILTELRLDVFFFSVIRRPAWHYSANRHAGNFIVQRK